jgi:NAD(P)-dependent dehydrogenase (short-subunit alcohol dehydrogenase family)
MQGLQADTNRSARKLRVVLITGTSSGFGLLTSVTLAKRGWTVIATMRDLTRRNALDAAAAAAGAGENIIVAQLDVTDRAQMSERVAALLALTGGRLDGVVHNAGVAVAAAFEDLPQRDLDRVMDTNFFGVLDLTRALLPAFRAARSGRIVFVSSDSAFAGEPTNAIYCASKFALEGFAESLAYEIEPFGLHAILIEPGPYKTDIWGSAPRIHPAGSVYGPLLDTLWPAVDKHVAKNAGNPQDVADVIASALEAKNPQFRYPVGPTARIGLLLRGKVSSPMLRRAISRYLGLHRVRL